jgi:hypothetical protein
VEEEEEEENHDESDKHLSCWKIFTCALDILREG